MSSLSENIVGILSEILDIPKDHLTLSEKLADLGVTSFDIIRFVIVFEEKYNVKVSDEDLYPDNYITIKAITDTLSAYVEEKD